MATTFGGDVIVGGNIAVGGFVVSGTLSSGTATVPNLTLTNSLTIGDVVVQKVGNSLDFSGPTITGLTLCGAAIGGGGGGGVPDPLTVSNLYVTASMTVGSGGKNIIVGRSDYLVEGVTDLSAGGLTIFTSGPNNVIALGTSALANTDTTTVNNVVLLGTNAGYQMGTVGSVVGIGQNAALGNSNYELVAIGTGAASNVSGGAAGNLIAIGSNAAANGYAGANLIALGENAGSSNSTSLTSHCIAIGTSAAVGVGGVGMMIAIGSNAAAGGGGGNDLIAIGTGAASGVAGLADVCIAIGSNALAGDSGSSTIAIGNAAGQSNAGDNCIFLGRNNGDPTNTQSDRFRVYSGYGSNPFLFGNLSNRQLAIGTETLSGALNVSGAATISGDLYLSAVRQPVVQFGQATVLSNTSFVDVTVTTPYIDTSYVVQVTGADLNANGAFWTSVTDASSFRIRPQAGPNVGADMLVNWTTFGYLF